MMGHNEEQVSRVKLAFERDALKLNLDQIVPLKTMRPGAKEGKNYAQIVSSVRAIGLVEAPVVTSGQKTSWRLFLARRPSSYRGAQRPECQ